MLIDQLILVAIGYDYSNYVFSKFKILFDIVVANGDPQMGFWEVLG